MNPSASLPTLLRYLNPRIPYEAFQTLNMAPQRTINWAFYNSLPPDQAQYQLAHVNDSKWVAILIAYIISIPICLLAVIMRFVSRRIGRTKYGADDWVMLATSVLRFSY